MPDTSRLRDHLAPWLGRCTFDPSGAAITCGVSGGADSLALAALAVATGSPVHVIHVDHGQRDQGDVEAAVVEAAATEIGASFTVQKVHVEGGSNLEARLRAQRYAVLGPEACTGHTADDQAETVLINLMRGSGVRGLGAMRPSHRRPILSLRRRDTEEICRLLGWMPVLDPTNEDARFIRNRVRHEVLPLLSAIADRDVVPLLTRTAEHSRAAITAVDRAADALDPTDAQALAAAPQAVAAAALQRWIRDALGEDHPIDGESVSRVLEVAHGRAVAAEVNGGHRVARSQQRLSIVAKSGVAATLPDA